MSISCRLRACRLRHRRDRRDRPKTEADARACREKKPAATIPVPAAAAKNTRTVTAKVYNRKNGPTMGYKEEKQHQLDMRYLRMARIWAENSYCVRRKVGALIVKDKMIISDGYNGTPAASRISARTKRVRPNPMSCTPKPTPLPRWPKAPTTATARRSTSPPPLVSNVRN